MTDSLIIGDQIELLGGGAVSAIAACAGAVFHLGNGYDLGVPDPTSDYVESLIMDGERPVGRRASNRVISLPVTIIVPPAIANQRLVLDAAEEVLLRLIDQAEFTLRWTRDDGPSATALPLVFDCYRASQAAPTYDVRIERQGVKVLTVSFPAAPYGRSAEPVTVDFPSPLVGRAAPPGALTLDNFTAISGTADSAANWLTAQQSGFDGPNHGWVAISGCTVATSAAQAHTGAQSLALTATGTADMIAALGTPLVNGMPVKKGNVVSVQAWVRAAATGRSVTVGHRFYDTSGNFLQAIGSLPGGDNTTAFTSLLWADFTKAPADGYAVPYVQVAAPVLAEVHYVDDVALSFDWHISGIGPTGSSAVWDPSLFGVPDGAGIAARYSDGGNAFNLQQGWALYMQNQNNLFGGQAEFPQSELIAAGVKAGDQFQIAPNWLATVASGNVHNGDFEGGTTGNWGADTNCSGIALSATAHGGSASLAFTSTAAGRLAVASEPTHLNGMPVVPGQTVFMSAWYRAVTTPQQCTALIGFYDAAGASVAFDNGATVMDSTGGWVQATSRFTAPARAVVAVAFGNVVTTSAAGETHLIDDVVLAVGASPVYTVTGVGAPFFGTEVVSFTPSNNPPVKVGDVLLQTGPKPALGAITFWAGLGSTNYYHSFLRAGGDVLFNITLTDRAGVQCMAHSLMHLKGSNDSGSPVWQRIRITLPPTPGFNFADVASYQIVVTNRGAGDLRYVTFYLDSLQAVPVATQTGAPVRGAVFDLAGIAGSARAPASMQFQQAGVSVLTTRLFTTPGGAQFLCPATVTTADVWAWGSGGNGSTITSVDGGGGGGGGNAHNAAVGLTPGGVYPLFVAPGGSGSGTPSTFTGDSATVSGPSGANAAANSTAGGTAGAAGSGGHSGGAGGLGVTGTGGGGGGSSAGTAGNGNAGASGGSGGAGGAAVTGGGAGGQGHQAVRPNPDSGTIPGGGGGGGTSLAGHVKTGGAGAGGQVRLQYQGQPGFATLIAHRPRFDAPVTLCPFVSFGGDDLPNNSIEYQVPSLIGGLNARFDGTYTVVLVNNTWAAPSSASTLTVTVTQYEQAGGAAYAQSTVPLSVVPNTLPGPFVVLGELTLPGKEFPQANLNGYFTVKVSDSQTGDRFLDVLFLDTQGSTVIIQSSVDYQNFYVDEPTGGRDVGLVLGSMFDRADALSILDQATAFSGTGLDVDPGGNQGLLVYAAEGAPSVQLTYSPRWMKGRIS